MGAGEWLLDLLFPPKCPFCQKVLDRPRELLCPECQETLPWLTGDGVLREVEFTSGCLSPLAYRGTVPESVRRYKFPGNPSYGKPYGTLVAQCIRDNRAAPLDLVTWVPLSRKRRRARGFDQAELLARTAAGKLGLPAEALLEKIRNNGPQSRLNGEAERRANVLGVYRRKGREALTGLHILLVDDVVTTGSTLSECARLLCVSGAEEVCCAALAQARKK